MVNVAMIAPYPVFPANEGGRVRAANLLRQWSIREGALLFAPGPVENAADAMFPTFSLTGAGRTRQFFDPHFLRRAPDIARDHGVEVVVAEYPWPALHAAYLARRLDVPFVLDLPNVEADRFRNTGSRWWPFVAAYERMATRLAKRVFVVSGDDAARLQQRGVVADRLRVVPNGVDPGEYFVDGAARSRIRAALGLATDTRAVLFFGQLSYEPNRRALETIRNELTPRLRNRAGRSEVVVAGKHGAGRTQGMRYIGAVDHMRPYINAADVVAVPVTSGGGTRLKILEAIACGTPVVSTSIGAEGIDRASCGELLTVTDDWGVFADALTSSDVKRGNTPPAFLDMYSWASIVSRIEWPD